MMIKVYLFDWGDTLMVDFPGVEGKMCDWQTVEVVEGAKETLQHLSKDAQIFIATSAANSSELDIQRAFQRGGLDEFISGYFCKENLGIDKGSTYFLNAILQKLGVDVQSVAMVGDNFNKDIEPAAALGMQSFWFKGSSSEKLKHNVKVIKNLTELYC